MQDQQVIDLLKGLVIDGVNKAKSGHPGGAMSSMDFAYYLFTEGMNFAPNDSEWIARDRFILSAGHESMLLYSLLHACDWLPMEQLEQFRQLDSVTPGHPEVFVTKGVECTTGPLGQGCAMSVGFALGASHFGAQFSKELFDHRTWVLLGDGCLQEGVTLAAASLAGHLGLSNLVWYYDKNKQQISGAIDRATSDDEALIFQGMGWEVVTIDAHNHDQIKSSISKAKQSRQKPLLIVGNSTMAKGAATLENSHNTHGAPLPQEERKLTKEKFGIPEGEDFYFPEEAKKHFQRNFGALEDKHQAWCAKFDEKCQDSKFKALYDAYFDKNSSKNLENIDWDLEKPLATRQAFGKVIADYANAIPNLIGGSADLEPSVMTGAFAKIVGEYTKETPEGRNISFGVREFPMSAIANGLALHGGFVPFDATFLSFADYSRPALRLGALQELMVIHEFTHDSFYLGEDGPTHQPIEHVMSLRAMPNMNVVRPADPVETEVLFRECMKHKTPASFCLTRQKVPFLELAAKNESNIAKGAWHVLPCSNPEVVIFATGSEVSLAIDAAQELQSKQSSLSGKVAVVSVPCWELFFAQEKAYRDEVLVPHCAKRVSVEAGSSLGWQKFVGADGLIIGLDHFGASAPAGDLAQRYGFTAPAISQRIVDFYFS